MAIIEGLLDSGLITLNVKSDFWRLYENKKLPNLMIQGLVDCDGKQKTIIIACSRVYGPKGLKMNTKSMGKELSTTMIGLGISNVFHCLVNYHLPYQYVVLGHIEGQIPILIAYYSNLDISFYTLDLTPEEKSLFKNLNYN